MPYFVHTPGAPMQNAPATHGVVTVPASPVQLSPTAALGTHTRLPATVLQKVASSHGAAPHGTGVLLRSWHSDGLLIPSANTKQTSGGRRPVRAVSARGSWVPWVEGDNLAV
jgi:hypothetical protein